MILISILGDFHSSIFPLFYEFKASISKHIVVYDDAFGEMKESKKILNSLEEFSKKYNLPIQTQGYQLQEDSFESISKLITFIEDQAKNEELYVNATDGLSNISVLLGARLLTKDIKLLAYDMHANTYNITTQESIEKRAIKSQMSIQDHFLLKGINVTKVEDKTFAHQNAAHIKTLFSNYLDEYKGLKRDLTRGVLKEEKYPRAMQLIKLMKLDLKTQQKDITGGLFEWYVYLLVKDLGFDDIEVGAVVEQEFTNQTVIRNEFDILLMKDNHLHMIECKFSFNVDITELAYKYATLLNFIDDDSRMIILTENYDYKPDLYNSQKQGLESYRRAYVNRIIVRNSISKHKEQFIDDVKSYFGVE